MDRLARNPAESEAAHCERAAGGADAGRVSVIVWDRAVRVFHWSLVLGVALCAATGFVGGKQMVLVHLAGGALIAGLIVFRLVWGFFGGTYARFASFVSGPTALIRHLRDVIAGKAGGHIGHNPVGGAMIMTLLSVLGVLVASGLISLGGVTKAGPLLSLSYETGAIAHRVHEVAAYLLVGLAVLHVLGVLLESRRTRSNLVAAMVTGQKAVNPDDHASPRRDARGTVAAATTAALLAAGVAVVVPASMQPAPGVPVAALDARYVKECGSCHSPHHPSLLPSEAWRRLMGGLADHFGDDASLDATMTAELTTFALANAAERWDTRASHLLRPPPGQDVRITGTAAWRREHRSVPEAAFKSKSVGGAVNCSRCHADAEGGRFLPWRIAVPAAPPDGEAR